jgi:hypothetical protein
MIQNQVMIRILILIQVMKFKVVDIHLRHHILMKILSLKILKMKTFLLPMFLQDCHHPRVQNPKMVLISQKNFIELGSPKITWVA